LKKKADLLCRGDEARYKDKNWLLLRNDVMSLSTPIGLKMSEIAGLP